MFGVGRDLDWLDDSVSDTGRYSDGDFVGGGQHATGVRRCFCDTPYVINERYISRILFIDDV